MKLGMAIDDVRIPPPRLRATLGNNEVKAGTQNRQ
jgi:hypothetical protein